MQLDVILMDARAYSVRIGEKSQRKGTEKNFDAG
jgi:hypothetical protein